MAIFPPFHLNDPHILFTAFALHNKRSILTLHFSSSHSNCSSAVLWFFPFPSQLLTHSSYSLIILFSYCFPFQFLSSSDGTQQILTHTHIIIKLPNCAYFFIFVILSALHILQSFAHPPPLNILFIF